MIRQLHVGGFDDNFSYFIEDSSSKNIAIVDPSNTVLLEEEINRNLFNTKMILLTHSHFDHTEGVAELVKKLGIPVYMHENARGRVNVPDEMSVFIKDGEQLSVLGKQNVHIIYKKEHHTFTDGDTIDASLLQ